MAVSINNVYQKVLALANKEQRGYITPQEFNLFADQAQQEIFEQYFYNLEQRQRAVGNEFDYADMVTNIEEKISLFEVADYAVSTIDNFGNINVSTSVPIIRPLHMLGHVKIRYTSLYGGKFCTVEQIQMKELEKYGNSPLAIWTSRRPVYVKYSDADSPVRIQIYPHPGADATIWINYIRKPKKPNWTYVISGTSGSALFNPDPVAGWQDFELHASEENVLVVKILQLAGVAIKDFNLAQMAGQKEVNTIQQQKQ